MVADHRSFVDTGLRCLLVFTCPADVFHRGFQVEAKSHDICILLYIWGLLQTSKSRNVYGREHIRLRYAPNVHLETLSKGLLCSSGQYCG